jgi:hypothetical protein
VEIRDANGVPRTAHTIALHGDDGRRQINETDSTGRAEFAWLPDGRYRLHAPLVPTKGSFSGGVLANAEIVGGSTALVPMVLPAPSGPIRVRLVADGVGDYSGWRAVHMQREGVAVEPNGTVPIDLSASNFRHLTISSPDRRQWKVTLPRDVRDGHEIPLRLDGPCYEGVVLDRASGAPVTNLLVTAGAPGSSVDAMRVSSSTRTDERGRFRVVCSASVPHSLGFESEKTTTLGGMSRDVYEGVHFDPTAPPLPSPDPIEIRIPYLDQDRFVGVPSKHLAGVVRCAGTREVARGAQVSITVTEPVEHGTLTFWSWCMAGEDGRYEIVVPDTSTYRAHVSDAQLGRSTDTTWEGLPGSDEVRDFELP